MTTVANYEVVVRQIDGVWQACVVPRQALQQTKATSNVSADQASSRNEDRDEVKKKPDTSGCHLAMTADDSLMEIKDEPPDTDPSLSPSGGASLVEFGDTSNHGNEDSKSKIEDQSLYLDERDGTMFKVDDPPEIVWTVKRTIMTRKEKLAAEAKEHTGSEEESEADRTGNTEHGNQSEIHLKITQIKQSKQSILKKKKKLSKSESSDSETESSEESGSDVPETSKVRQTRQKRPKIVRSNHHIQLVLLCPDCDTKYKLNILSTSELGKLWMQDADRNGPWIACTTCEAIKLTKVEVSYPRLTDYGKLNKGLPKPSLVCMEDQCKRLHNGGLRCKTSMHYFNHYKAVHLVSCMACEFCGGKFRNTVRLRRHINSMHLSVEPCVCSQCGKTFRNRYRLSAHLHKTHSGKPTKCDICGETLQASSMKKHLLTHVDKKQRTHKMCDMCGKSFLSDVGLNEHMLSHKSKHVCPYCGKQLTTKAGLKYHEDKCRSKQTTAV